MEVNKVEYSKLKEGSALRVGQHQIVASEEAKQVNVSGRSSFLRLLRYTYRHKMLLVIGNFSLIITSLSLVAIPYLTGQMIDSITKTQSNERLDGLTLQFLGLMVLSGFFGFTRAVSYNLLGEKVTLQLRQDLFSRLVEKDIEFFDRNRSGELISRLTSDISVIQSGASDTISILLRNLVQFFGSLGLLWVLSWKLTLVLIAVIPPFVVLVTFFVRYYKSYSKTYQKITAEATQIATEVLGNMRIVRSFSTESKEKRSYSQATERAYGLGYKRALLGGAFQGIGIILGFGVILGILYYGGRLVLDGELTVGDLSSFVLYTLTMTFSLLSVSGMVNSVVQSAGLSEKIFELMDEYIRVQDGNREVEVEGAIEFKGVYFSYPSKENVTVLRDLSISIKSGEVVAFVGQSGSGKSTIVSLLERFYDVNLGTISFDGIDVRSYKLEDLHRQIGYVSQEPTLFSGTLRENIVYGVQDATEEEIDEAMRMAHALEFVKDPSLFPEGLQTVVGERGIKLSGGQKQRIAIARALIKKPKILIFDEATSALDAESEFQVQSAIDGLVSTGQKTIILIAHRLSTIINSHKIVVIQKGEIVEMGSHKELLEKNGYYKQLIEKQLG